MKHILFVGMGHMGRAFASALLSQNKPEHKEYRLYAVKPSPFSPSELAHNEMLTHITRYHNTSDASAHITADIDAIILAVKPEHAQEVLSQLVPYISTKITIISMVAGLPISYIRNMLDAHTEKKPLIARIMPTMAAIHSESLTGIAFDKEYGDEHHSLVKDIVSAAGRVLEISESQIHAITGISGSGVAFVAEFIHGLTLAGVREGLSYQQSYESVLQTVRGALALLAPQDKTPTQSFSNPQELIAAICSPHGTTIEGLHALHKHNMTHSVFSAVHAATEKSKQISTQWTD